MHAGREYCHRYHCQRRPCVVCGGLHNPGRGCRQPIQSSGYTLLFYPRHPAADARGYVKQHRLVVEESLGRYLSGAERVHHINHDRSDNRLGNLKVVTGREHARAHKAITTGDQARELFKQGVKQADIARRLGVSRQRINQVVRE